ncbi:MAG: serine/threonine protein kinase [Sandaracinus sp.]|nr:serine/threonine protein kinase [Sandaracinus sp.]
MDPASHSLAEKLPPRTGDSRREPGAGDVLGRYELLFPIASGGMATVYAARIAGEHGFQKPVALKLMLPHLARDDRFVRMFLDEATLAARVVSPHVVSTLDLGREGDTLYMAMELVVGPSLRELLGAVTEAGETMPASVAGTIALQVARGLADAHRARGTNGEPLHLVHRDVSPHNVLVGVDGRVRLGDFGVALAVERHARTETGEVKGKLAYFSPEQLENEPLDQRSDVFSLAAVAWECFVGRRLFSATNPLALAAEVAYGEITRVDVERPDVPREVADVIAAALERDPAARTDSAETFARHLAEALGASCGIAEASEIGELARQRTHEAVADLEARLSVAMSLPNPRWEDRSGLRTAVRPPSRRGPVAAVVTAVALAIGAGLGWWVARTAEPDTSRTEAEAAPTGSADELAASTALGVPPSREESAEAPEAAETQLGDAAASEATASEATASEATASEASASEAAASEATNEPLEETAAVEERLEEARATEADATPRRRRRARRTRETTPADSPRPREGLLLDVRTFDAQRQR